MDPVTGSIIAKAGSSIIAGLFGRKKQSTSSTVDYVKLRKNAEKAGFNPLTALQNGGAAGFTTQTSPALSSQELIGQALGAGFETAFNGPQIRADAEREAIETQLLREELKDMQESTKVVRERDFGYGIPQVTTYSGIDHAAPAHPTMSPRDPSASGAGGAGNDPDVPSTRVYGVEVPHNKNYENAQDFEDRYGDLASSLYGGAVLAADFIPFLGRTAGEVVSPYVDSYRLKRMAKKAAEKRARNPHTHYDTVRHAGPLSAFR